MIWARHSFESHMSLIEAAPVSLVLTMFVGLVRSKVWGSCQPGMMSGVVLWRQCRRSAVRLDARRHRGHAWPRTWVLRPL